MIYLILDTNVWIYLCNGLDPISGKHSDNAHFELLDKLKKYTENQEISVLVNDIIISEFDRNKSHTGLNISKLTNKLKEGLSFIKGIDKYTTDKINLEKIKIDYERGVISEISRNTEHIKNVEKFLIENCTLIPITDEIKLKTVSLAIDKKAPFHNSKNNFSDACILFSADEYLSAWLSDVEYDSVEDHRAIFISNNINDFCQKELTTFHPEIKQTLKCKTISFERVLPAAMNLSSKFIAEFREFQMISSMEFLCESEYCNYQQYLGYGLLDRSFVVDSDFVVKYDPNQLELFPDTYPRPKREVSYVPVGTCNICESLHIKCPECNTIITDFSSNEVFQCNECLNYLDVDEYNEVINVVDNNLMEVKY